MDVEITKLLASSRGTETMAEMAELEKEFEYTIEIDDGTEYVHLYFADVIDIESPSFLRFDPTYELSHEIERKVTGEAVLVPYSRIIRVIKRKPE